MISNLSLKYNTQTASLLISLPAEIRLQIWQYAVGGNEFRLIQKGNRIGIDRRFDPSSWYPKYLNFLLTCRQIYSEAIDLLYSSNTFEIPDPRILIFFHDYCILPKRWNRIQHLYISYCSEVGWNFSRVRAWELIAKMPLLSDLTVGLVTSRDTRRAVTETDLAWLQPLLQVKGVRKLRIEVVDMVEHGKRDNAGWRDVLEEHLREAGNGVEFVEAKAWRSCPQRVCTFPMH